MKKRNLTLFDAGIAFVMAFVLAQLTSIIGISLTEAIMKACGRSATQISAFWDNAVGYLLQALFMNIGFVLLFIWYYKRINKNDIFAKASKPTYKYFGICIIIGISSLFLLSGVLNYFQLLVDKLGFTSASLKYDLDSTKNYLISLISLAIIPAICEELIFRGILVNALKQKSEIFAIILSSVMFSIFHFSPAQLLYPIFFGMILSILYLRTKNIIFPIILHFINNALSLSIQYFSSSSEVFTHSAFMLIYAFITFAIWFVIMCYLFKDFIKTRQNSSTDNINNTTAQNNENITSSKLSKNDIVVLCGSIAIMLLLYIILL